MFRVVLLDIRLACGTQGGLEFERTLTGGLKKDTVLISPRSDIQVNRSKRLTLWNYRTR
jgi:hypothetical protein